MVLRLLPNFGNRFLPPFPDPVGQLSLIKVKPFSLFVDRDLLAADLGVERGDG
jgi:hypothetical protein